MSSKFHLPRKEILQPFLLKSTREIMDLEKLS
jgi:hypothetical protein